MAASGGGKAEQAGDSRSLELLARVGLVAYAVVHLLIAWLAAQLAWGVGASKSADLSGAMRTGADQPLGKFVLWLVAVGLVALALWQASEVIWGYRNREAARRVRMQVASGAKSVVYAALGASAASVALGSGSSSSQSQQQATSGVLAFPRRPGGRRGRGVDRRRRRRGGGRQGREGSPSPRRSTPRRCHRAAQKAVAWLGQVGYIAKGLALGLVGSLLGYAALTFNRQKAPGLDGTLQTILAQPFGKYLLTVVALGFLAFGLFALLQTRYRRM